MVAPEIHTITRIGANGNYSTGGTDIGPHRGGSGSGGSSSWNEIAGKPNFARVATTGSYNDLSNKPTIPAAYDDTALKNRVTALENKTDQDTKPVLVSALIVNNAMGQATAGKTYPAGTLVEVILRDILTTGSTPTPTPTTEIKVYATVSSITSLDEVNIEPTLNEYILNVPAQTEENPVIIEVPTARGVKLTIWNPLTNQWVESPQKWDTTSVTHDGVAYTRYTENCECGAAATRIRLSDWT